MKLLLYSAGFVRQKRKTMEDGGFCLIEDGIFFSSKEPGTVFHKLVEKDHIKNYEDEVEMKL
jgi:hypothetical protein